MRSVFGWAAVLFWANLPAAAPAAPTDVRAVAAAEAIIDALGTHQLVALGEYHQNEEVHALLRRVVRDPRFADLADDIVVEFGNARYQEMVNRYVDGESVPDRQLERVWQDTTVVHGVWDVPVYAEFFRAVRTANAVSKGRKLRVLLGDPPVDWAEVDAQQLRQWQRARDAHAADLIEREVIRRGRRALIVYGFWHLRRTDESGSAYSPAAASAPLVPLIEQRTGVRVFSIATVIGLESVYHGAASWPIPAIAPVRGTALGRKPFNVAGRATGALEDIFDAVLYVGPESGLTWSRLPLSLLRDTSYLHMRMSRAALAVLAEQ